MLLYSFEVVPHLADSRPIQLEVDSGVPLDEILDAVSSAVASFFPHKTVVLTDDPVLVSFNRREQQPDLVVVVPLRRPLVGYFPEINRFLLG